MRISKGMKETACNGLVGLITGGSVGLAGGLSPDMDNKIRAAGYATIGIPAALPHIKTLINVKKGKIKKMSDYSTLENPSIQSAIGSAAYLTALIAGGVAGSLYRTISGG